MPEKTPNLIRRLNVLLRLGFFLTGIVTVLIGQLLPILIRRLEINDRQAGYFFIAQFTGSLAGTLTSTWFARRNKFLLAIVWGSVLIACGVLILNSDSFVFCLLGFFLNGTGIGLILPAVSMLTLELNPTGSSAALNVLNFFWGVGAILSQPFVDVLSRGNGIFIPTLTLAVLFLAVGIIIRRMPREFERDFFAPEEKDEDFAAPPIWGRTIAWLIAFFSFINVGFESGMGGWLKSYTQRIEDGEPPLLFSPILLYFIFFVLGRAAAPIFLRFLSENKLLFLNLLIVLSGTSILLFAADVWFLSLGASIAGFGTSSVFPINVSRFTKTFGSTATRRATPLFLCGTLGAAFTTWTIGFTSDYFGNLRAGMFVLLISSVTLIVLQSFLALRKAK
jgi:fucose permease